MEMREVTSKDGSLRPLILGTSSGLSQDQPTAIPSSVPNPHAMSYPAQSPYADSTPSKYSRSGFEETRVQQEHDHQPSSRVFATNGVHYAGPALNTISEAATRSRPNSEPNTAPLQTHQESEATTLPPWGTCPFLHVVPSEEVEVPAPVPAPAAKTIVEIPKDHRSFRPAISTCCFTSRPDTPPTSTHHHDHSQNSSETAALSHQNQSKECSVSESRHVHFHSSGTCCSASDCSSEGSSLKELGDYPIDSERDDVERGPPNLERVVLRIDGLKCGCCEGGLSRAVSRIPGIQNHQVNIVLARVEFDLDTNRLSVEDVIKRLATKTGYTFEEQVASDGQVLEFIITDPRLIKHVEPPFGVIRVEAPEREPWRPLQRLSGRNSSTPRKGMASASDSNPVEEGSAMNSTENKRGISNIRIPPTKIHYDATKIGARDVFDYYKKSDPDLCLAPPAAHPGLDLGAKQTRRALKWFIPTALLTIPVVVLAWAPIDHENDVYVHISLGLATVVQVIAIREFVPGAIRSLYHSRVFEMDFLIAFSTTLAYTFSVVSYVFQLKDMSLDTGSFFETSTLLVTLILLGRVINEFARFRAAKSVSFRSLQVDEALLVLPQSNPLSANTQTKRIDVRLLQYGDTFKIPPHTKVVTDGFVLYGGSDVDESMITGESKPIAKGLSSEVFAGTNNGDGILLVKVTKLPHENSVHKIAALVEDAELTKPKTQALADRVAGWFVPAIAIIGLLVFLIWLFVDKYLNNNTWKSAVITAITYAIATLIVSCPCAIGLAVPMVVLIAGGVAARFGIIIRDPQKLEIARNVTDIVFDKTGTLTCGNMEVFGVPKYLGLDKLYTKGLLMGLLKDIAHPVSIGVMRHLSDDRATNRDFEPLSVIDVTSVSGKGVRGRCAESGAEVRAGNADWLNVNVSGRATSTMCYVTINSEVCAIYELADRPRPTAAMVIEKLHGRGIDVHMISGDNEGAVSDIAGALHIRRENTKSRCKPEGKMNYVKDLQKPGNVVMFVGDGTNDSVALKQANVGVHVNQGSDVAKSAADVVLMTTRLHDVLILLDISGAAYRRIVLNFTWSTLYNFLAILLAAGAFVKAGEQIRIKPQWAGLGELVSVLPVVLIAFQMRWRNYGKSYRLIKNDYRKAEVPKRERRVRTKGSSTSESAGCCEVSTTTLAKIDAITR